MSKNGAIKLFEFLKELSDLRTRKVLDVDNFEKVLWFNDIPNENECYSITHELSPELSRFEIWIEIKKPKIRDYPEPPSAIEEWIKESTLKNYYNESPELYDHILLEQSDNENERTTEDKILLENMPRIKERFEQYCEESWIPWAKERIRLGPVSSVYNELFEIYHKNKNQGENYQVVLGLGLLSTKTKKERAIKRHIVTSPLAFNFNSITGTITIGPGEQNAELSLELDMLETNEKPDISDQINSDLDELNNDFWTDEKFYNCLNSWINRFDPNSQFYKVYDTNYTGKKFTTLSPSPAIILRHRGERVFSKFYKDVIKDLETNGQTNSCLSYITDENQGLENIKDGLAEDGFSQLSNEKYYFPLPVNEEQKSIITKLSNSVGILVQGPPGTGKTHSIANLICHLLAVGEKILVTSQADRALKVLKNKLPDDLKALCVEVLGQDQKSLLELKNSVYSINSKYQEWDDTRNKANIERLEKKDNDFKSSLVTIERKISEVKEFETRLYEKHFGFYSGTAGKIATQIKNEKELYSWILEEFNLKDFNTSSPISNDEGLLLLKSLEKLKNTSDSVLEEPLEFLNKVLTKSEFKEKLSSEKEAIQIIEKNNLDEDALGQSDYNNFSDQDFNDFFKLISSIIKKIKALESYKESWIIQAKHECISDRDRPWRHLLNTTHEILDSNKEIFLSIDKTKFTYIPKNLDEVELSVKLDDFFKKFSQNDNIKWGFFCSREVRSIKKVIKELKVDGRNCNTYEQVKLLKKWIKVNIAKKKLLEIWSDKTIVKNNNFGTIYHSYKDLCEPLEECLEIHKFIRELKKLLDEYPNVPPPCWDSYSLKNEYAITKVIKARKEKNKVEAEFENYISLLNLHRGQKNQIASKIIKAYQKRSIDLFNEAIKSISDFINNKKEFQDIAPIKRKIDNAKGRLFKSLRENIDNSEWVSRLENFEEAWAWYRAKVWIKKSGDSEYLKELARERENLIKDIQTNLEVLVSEKSWRHCLSNITPQQQASLKGWAHAVSKIGKGTGKTAPKHRKIAKQRMTECKGAIPAWIMPLYRVVENIKPGPELFDVAIIDEASQTGPDGLLLHYLAKKIIVVGDNEQISPEMPGIRDDHVELLKKKYLSNLKFADHIGREYSYYDYCDICFPNQIQLREHFRCMPEIIQFSNKLSYSGKPLIPMRQYGSSRLPPLKNTFVEGAVSKVGNAKNPQNDREAEAIINQIKECFADPVYKNKTFGIISLQGHQQIKRIEYFLEQELDKATIEEREIIVGDAYDFQGDERDVIFLSMAVSNDYNFAALTKDTYKKRYNVAASRAKDQMWLFHSVRPDELSPYCFRKKLLSHCMSYEDNTIGWPREDLMKLYERIEETKNKSPKNAPHPFDSWFEARVFFKIANRDFLVIPQFSVSNYRIDMIVIGPNGRLAVECDGDHYHSEKDEVNDLSRQWDLERCGWVFWRVRYSAFCLDQKEALKGLWEKLEKMKIYPLMSNNSKLEINSDINKNKEIEQLKNDDKSIALNSKFDVTKISHIDPRDNITANIAKELLEIIEVEGPIVTKRLYKLHVKSCGISKIGKQIKKKLNKSAYSLKYKNLIIFEKESMTNGMQEGVFYIPNTPRVVIRKNTDRTIDEIPLAELQQVLNNFRAQKTKFDDEEIFRATLEFYGFKRLTSVAQARLQDALKYSI